jgi:feruloyl esterase
MSNQESLTNFAYGSLKKTHDVAVTLVKTLYGAAPRHSYFMGSSQGGREALMVVQRFPQDYDGVFSQVPVFPQVYWNMLEEVLRSQTQAGDAWLPRTKVPVIQKEVLRQCDALDGLADGLVSNYLECDNRFNPAISPNALAAVRCPGGADTGDTCLSDAQIGTVNKAHGIVEFGFPLAHGWASMPGYPTGGEVANWRTLQAAPTADTPLTGPLQSLVVRDSSVTLLSFKLADYRARIQELSALLDATDPDISAFRRRGGKLILKVNSTDYTGNQRWASAYYRKVVDLMGQANVYQFMRYYVGIGIYHSRNIGTNPLTNELVPSYVDFIGMLDDWVENGTTPPDAPILKAMDPTPPYKVNASFPMCRYPLYPRYKGKGDPKSAENFVCSK